MNMDHWHDEDEESEDKPVETAAFVVAVKADDLSVGFAVYDVNGSVVDFVTTLWRCMSLYGGLPRTHKPLWVSQEQYYDLGMSAVRHRQPLR